MRKQQIWFLLFLLSLTSSVSIKAADLVVAAGGAGGAYPSINAALAAAAPNDRIIVYPQAGGASYSDTNIRITKSIQILSAQEGAYYAVDAPNIFITPPSAGMNVTIIGLKLLTGGISSTINAPTGARSNINLLNDSLANGAVTFDHDNYNLTVGSCHVQAGVTMRFGRIIGNIIRSAVRVNTDGSVNNPNDTVMVVGNQISFTSTSVNDAVLTWNSSSQFFNFQNNYIQHYQNINYSSYRGNGIAANAIKNSNLGGNAIINNTVFCSSNPGQYGILFSGVTNNFVEILNNIVLGSFFYSIVTSGQVSAHFNYFTAGPTGFNNDGTNVTVSANTSLSATGQVTNPASNTVNGGTPDSAYADIDLTRNDAGCYGGSFTLNNFFPITSNDWARVLLVTAPRRVLVNGIINVRAVGFDK